MTRRFNGSPGQGVGQRHDRVVGSFAAIER